MTNHRRFDIDDRSRRIRMICRAAIDQQQQQQVVTPDDDISKVVWRTTCSVINFTKSTADVNSRCDPTAQQRSKFLLPLCHRRNRLNSLLKFSSFLFRFVIVTSLIFTRWINMSTAAPVGNSKRSANGDNAETTPRWMQLCYRFESSPRTSDQTESEPDKILLNSVLTVANFSDKQLKEFREHYVNSTFGEDFNKHHMTWKDQKYDWLQGDFKLPIDLLSPNVPKEHLNSLNFDEVVLNIYGHLQRLAVAFENVTRDHKNENSKFADKFEMAEKQLSKILCEIRDIIPASKLNTFNESIREMIPKFRHMNDSSTQRHIRDWLIFREYMTLIRYIIEVMNHFMEQRSQ